MDKWECSVCGYVYDPERGDPEHNIPLQTPFEQLPDNWTCPVCGAPKTRFIKKTKTTKRLHNFVKTLYPVQK